MIHSIMRVLNLAFVTWNLPFPLPAPALLTSWFHKVSRSFAPMTATMLLPKMLLLLGLVRKECACPELLIQVVGPKLTGVISCSKDG